MLLRVLLLLLLALVLPPRLNRKLPGLERPLAPTPECTLLDASKASHFSLSPVLLLPLLPLATAVCLLSVLVRFCLALLPA